MIVFPLFYCLNVCIGKGPHKEGLYSLLPKSRCNINSATFCSASPQNLPVLVGQSACVFPSTSLQSPHLFSCRIRPSSRMKLMHSGLWLGDANSLGAVQSVFPHRSECTRFRPHYSPAVPYVPCPSLSEL